MLFSPNKGWQNANKERDAHDEFINNFLFPIFGFISITTFIGSMWLTEEGGIHYALKMTIAVVASLFGGFYIASLLVNELFPKYGMIKDIKIAQRFVGYSSIAIYLLYFVMPMLSGLGILWIFALYTLLLTHSGTNYFLDIEKNKRVAFSVISFLVILLSPMSLNYLLSLIVI